MTLIRLGGWSRAALRNMHQTTEGGWFIHTCSDDSPYPSVGPCQLRLPWRKSILIAGAKELPAWIDNTCTLQG